MTFRLYDQLEDTLQNDFKFHLEETQVVKGFYPYLYLKNSPEGVFTFKVSKDLSVIFEKSFTSQDIKESLETEDNSAYVFFPVLPSPYLLLGKGAYTASLTATGYYPSESSHMGWIKMHKYPVNDIDYVPSMDAELPLAMKIKTIQKAIYI